MGTSKSNTKNTNTIAGPNTITVMNICFNSDSPNNQSQKAAQVSVNLDIVVGLLQVANPT